MARRSVMTLFSAPTDPWSHRARLVLAEKGIAIELVNCDPHKLPEDLLDLNPYHSVPTLVDRDLVLYDSRVIIEYLDERFPHPPLMPIDPVTRAQFRVALYRVERDWYGLAQDIDQDRESKTAAHSRKVLCEAICASAEVFKAKPFFLSDEFSLVDASIAPILWRLPFYGIELPRAGAAHREVHELDFRALHLPRMPERRRTGDAALKPRRPYLLRALHEWISDSGETPHIVVDAAAEGVVVPRQYVKDGKIVLNVSFSATQMLKMGNDVVSFEARFSGASFAVQVPVRAILGIYARETGQGMIFPEGDADPDPTPPAVRPAGAPGSAAPAAKRPKLQVVK